MWCIFPDQFDVGDLAKRNVFATYFLLFKELVPMPLLILLEVFKTVYSILIEYDIGMHMFKDYNNIPKTPVWFLEYYISDEDGKFKYGSSRVHNFMLHE